MPEYPQEKTMTKALVSLNAAQLAAVQSPASVLQVLAPPGSGKTKTLTARVAHLVNSERIAPWSMIVCTFTVKAAREMRERLKELIGEGVEKQLILGTFHSVARRFLVRYGQLIDIPKNFGIADTSDTEAMLRRIVKRRKIQASPKKARSRISFLKARGKGPEKCPQNKESDEWEDFALVYSEYEQLLKTSNLLDYDDLLLRCRELLQNHPSCVKKVNAVLIDEFQDTNYVQYDLMKLFAQESKKITIVGDPDQSIYGFRSAEIKNILIMRDDFPETTTVALEENYRSSGSILLTAMEVIEQDRSRLAKRILPTHCTGVQPVLLEAANDNDEACWIVSEIEYSRAFTGNLLNHDDYAILLRSASISRQIEAALSRSGIPYRMVGGLRFFDRVEVKLVLDYMRVIDQPGHSEAITRIVNVPPRRVGGVTMKKLITAAEEDKRTLWSLLLEISEGSDNVDISKAAREGIQRFVGLIKSFQMRLITIAESEFDLAQFIRDFLGELGLREFLKKNNPAEEYEGRWGNVLELVAQASDTTGLTYEQSLENNLPKTKEIKQRELNANEDFLAHFLSNIALSTEVEKEDEKGTEKAKVTISTIHAAKGLEWPVVFIPSAYDGSIPHSRAEDCDEERRLLYVGMTRAKALLYISYPLAKKKNSDDEPYRISPFLSEGSIQLYFTKCTSLESFTLVQDLARILGRKCPTEVKIFRAAAAHRVKMNEIAEQREEENKGSAHSHMKGYNYHNFSKNRKHQMNDYSTPHLGISHTTTMQNSEHYSVSFTTVATKFISARAVMKPSSSTDKSKEKCNEDGITSSKRIKSESSESRKATISKPINAFFKPLPVPTSEALTEEISVCAPASSKLPQISDTHPTNAPKAATAQSIIIRPQITCSSSFSSSSSSTPSCHKTEKLVHHRPSSISTINTTNTTTTNASTTTTTTTNIKHRNNKNHNPAFKCPVVRRKNGNSNSSHNDELPNPGAKTITATTPSNKSLNFMPVVSKNRPPPLRKGSTGPLIEILNPLITVPGIEGGEGITASMPMDGQIVVD